MQCFVRFKNQYLIKNKMNSSISEPDTAQKVSHNRELLKWLCIGCWYLEVVVALRVDDAYD